jgi:hypothetical protein
VQGANTATDRGPFNWLRGKLHAVGGVSMSQLFGVLGRLTHGCSRKGYSVGVVNGHFGHS